MMDLNKLRTQRFLGLGCSTFGGSTGAGAARASLNRAFEQGIVYFDVARSYGYGQAEGIVGKFARGKRDQVIIASKFGIVPPNIPFKPFFLWGAAFGKRYRPCSKR
jgi:aryl-alcohol dehydrogenase-like predicted oxidoreductase